MTPPISPVFISIEENPNCPALDGQIFRPRTEPRPVNQVRCERMGEAVWCSINGLDAGDAQIPAMACLVDDSGDGVCYLVFGGEWGLRLRDEAGETWGAPYMLLPRDGSDLRFE